MADIKLTQEDADALLAMEKHKADDAAYEYPSLGSGIRVPLLSPDKREPFFLDITRSQIKLTKGTYQNRARAVPASHGAETHFIRPDEAEPLVQVPVTFRCPRRPTPSTHHAAWRRSGRMPGG